MLIALYSVNRTKEDLKPLKRKSRIGGADRSALRRKEFYFRFYVRATLMPKAEYTQDLLFRLYNQ
jgi:hypothetical protein